MILKRAVDEPQFGQLPARSRGWTKGTCHRTGEVRSSWFPVPLLTVAARCRGRDSGCPLPPAQTRACGATAHGSYFGCDPLRRRRATFEVVARVHRSPPGDTLSLIWVRHVLAPWCSPPSQAFPPPPPPPVSPPTWFDSFAGTRPVFDSSPAFTPGWCFWLPVPIRRLDYAPDADEVSRFSRV